MEDEKKAGLETDGKGTDTPEEAGTPEAPKEGK